MEASLTLLRVLCSLLLVYYCCLGAVTSGVMISNPASTSTTLMIIGRKSAPSRSMRSSMATVPLSKSAAPIHTVCEYRELTCKIPITIKMIGHQRSNTVASINRANKLIKIIHPNTMMSEPAMICTTRLFMPVVYA